MSPRTTKPSYVVQLLDDYWLEPLHPGQRLMLTVTLRGTECAFTIEADELSNGDVGWARAVGFGVGPYSVAVSGKTRAAREDAVIEADGSVVCEPTSDAAVVLQELLQYALETLDAFEATRTIRVALAADGLTSPVDFDTPASGMAARKRRSEQVQTAARIHDLVLAAGRSNPGPWVQQWMGIGSSTYFALMREAKEQGLVKHEAQHGRPRRYQPSATRAKQSKRGGKGK